MTNYDDTNFTGEDWKHNQVVWCNTSYGLLCSNTENSYEVCHNHLIRVCCKTTTTTPTIPTTTTTATPPSTTTKTPTTTTTTTTVKPPSTTTETSTASSTTTTVSTSTPTIPTTTSTVTPLSTTTTITTTVTPPSTTTETSTASSTTTTVSATTPTIPTTTTTVTPPSTTTETSTASSTTTTVSTTTPTTTTTATPPSTTTETPTTSSTTTTESTTTPTIPTNTSTVTPLSTTTKTPTTSTTTTTVKPPSTTTTGTTSTPTITTTTTTVTPPSTTTEIFVTTPTTTVTPTPTKTEIFTTTATTRSTSTEFTVYTGSPFNSTTPGHHVIITTTTTTTCYCTYKNAKYPAGSIINSLQDECYTAYCNSSCNIVKKIRFDNHTTEECTIKTCKDGKVISEHVHCDPIIENPKCVNTIPPVKVYYNNGCCYKYECECFCKSWGDPHYRTFDGLYYTFHGNCTYVLFQEIIPRYNISVHAKNYYCNPTKHLACPEYVIVYYKSYKIKMASGKNNVIHVYVNDEEKKPTYIIDSIIITSTGMEVTLNISEIKTQITVSNLNVQIRLPFSYFHDNTQGQCGYCDNSTISDCRLPNGTIDNSCEHMAQFWMVSPGCELPPPLPTLPSPTRSPNITVCKIISGNLFNSCHNAVPYQDYYEACVYDVSRMGNESIACSSVEAYAQLCGQKSICVDWRNSAVLKGLCEFKCPSHKIYKACGPRVEKSCSTSYNDRYAEDECHSSDCNQTVVEGCYCPDGQYRVNMTSNMCTSYCDCINPDGLARKPGDTWTVDCNIYNCTTSGIPLKEPVKCPTEMACADGYKRTVKNCCPTCVCDLEKCRMKKCDVGFELALNKTEDSCCPCVHRDVCVYNNSEYKVGEVRHYTCETVTCLQINGSFVIQTNNTECSSRDCDPGFRYEKKEGECCGSCRQYACSYVAPDNTTHVLKAGEVHIYKCENVTCRENNGLLTTEKSFEKCTDLSSRDCEQCFEYVEEEGKCCGTCRRTCCIYNAPDNTRHTLQVQEAYKFKCTTGTCNKINGSLMIVESIKKCPDFNPKDCVPGTLKFDTDGCCQICETSNCVLEKNIARLHVDDCTSVKDVEVTSCTGHCDSKSMYSMYMNDLMHSCSCCQEEQFTLRPVMVKCTNSSEILHNYKYIESCSCTPIKCKDQKYH